MPEFRFIPQVAVWELTSQCDMRCIHCGTASDARRKDELSTEEALRLSDDLARAGCRSISLLGGEPLLRDDWHLVAHRLSTNGIGVGLITNGFALDEGKVEQMIAAGVGMVGIGVDGPEMCHDLIRRREGAFRRTMEAIDLLRESGIGVSAITQVIRPNLGYLPEIHELLCERGIKMWQIQLAQPTGRMKGRFDLLLGPSHLVTLADLIVEMKREGKLYVHVGENIGYFNDQEAELRDGNLYQGCYAGLRAVGITSDGRVKGCHAMPDELSEGDIRSRPFQQIWEDPNNFSYNRRFTLEGVGGFCRECPHLRECRCGCTTTAYGATGSRFDNPFCLYRIEHEPEEESFFRGRGDDATISWSQTP